MGESMTTDASPGKLSELRNVGPAFMNKSAALGVESVKDLASRSADDLYIDLCHIEGERLDPCVHDVFAATIHQARTGEPLIWWDFSGQRKQRQRSGDFPDL